MVIASHRVKNGQNSTQKKQHFFMYFRILISVSAFIALLPYDGCGGKVSVCIIVWRFAIAQKCSKTFRLAFFFFGVVASFCMSFFRLFSTRQLFGEQTPLCI